MPLRRRRAGGPLLVMGALALLAAACSPTADTSPDAIAAGEPATTVLAVPMTTTTTLAPTTTTAPIRQPGTVPAWTFGQPWGEVEGLTMFRGNPTRSFHGVGPAPRKLALDWRYPESAMCGNSPAGGSDLLWCGSGWTGQPVVWERPDGITELIFGAYDKQIHFLDAHTGERTRPSFPMGDIIKGSVTLDPDGYPLLYAGSRDPNFRIIALDREVPTEIWSLNAGSVQGRWNNDWDSNPVVVDDMLYVGGENSWLFAIELNRSFEGGMVDVDPHVVFSMPAWTDQLLRAVGNQQSIESSVVLYDKSLYFTNSAGRVAGLDISDIKAGEAPVVFDFWAGDDIDATPIVDRDGDLYVAVEVDLATSRAAEVGQLIKLDPDNPDDPVVWSVGVPTANGVAGGLWATPVIVGDVIFAATNPGELLAVDTTTGEVLWRDDVGVNAWSSPVFVDDTLVLAVRCFEGGAIRAYDVFDPRRPIPLWEVPHQGGGCIESTPAVWKGRVYVGARDGFFYAYDGT